ncbi:MAG: molybdopterin-dependent aldehyde oxidoreductase [Oscillospiraceae bacterium]
MLRKFLNINGVPREVIVENDELLVNVLRNQLKLTGTKMACGNGQCGACSVILNNQVVRSCLKKMEDIEDGATIITVEGLGNPQNLNEVQMAFVKHGCTQCGFCIPGFIVSATHLLQQNNNPTREEVRDTFFKNQNLCRCTGYRPMVDAVMDAAKVVRGEEPKSYLEYKDPDDGRIWGTRHPRPTAVDKVCGTAKYGADMGYELPPGTLRLALVQATVHHANILSVDTSEAEKMPGVEFVITCKDIKGTNRIFGLPMYPWSKTDGFERPILCDEKVFQFGDAIAVVCADSTKNAREAAKKVVIEYEELPAYLTAEEATAEGAAEIHPGTPNVYYEADILKGEDADEVMKRMDFVVEDDFFTQRQPHLLIEPDVGFSYMDEAERLTIQSKSIAIGMHRAMIAGGLGLKPKNLRIVQNLMGGSFGYKLSPTMEAICGAVTLATGRPAYLEYSGYQNIIYTGKRAPNSEYIKLGADKDGYFKALTMDALMDHGAYSELGDLLLNKVLRFTGSGYNIPSIKGHGRTSYTNHAFASAMRAYGAPQGEFGSEVLIDKLAEKMGMDPWEIRYKNVLRPGGTLSSGDEPDVYPLPGLMEMIKPKYDKLKAECAKKSTADKKYGVGLAVGIYNVGSETADASDVEVELMPDGSITVYNTWEDHGQGGDMGTLQTTHEALRPLGIREDQIHMVMNDTALCPNSGSACASRSQFMTGNATVDACTKLIDAMRKDDGSFRTHEEMVAEEIPTRIKGSFSIAPWCTPMDKETMQYKPVLTYMYGVFLAEVEVDITSGKVRVPSMTASIDVGNIGNWLLVEGQVYGGLAQGIGMALSEDYQDVKKHSTMRGAGIPTIKDVPDDMDVMFQQTPRPQGPFGAAGIGELPTTSPHAAIINAIYNACGARVTRLPARPEKVLAALQAK